MTTPEGVTLEPATDGSNLNNVTKKGMSRRTFLKRAGIGAGGIAVVAAAGGAWRVVDQGILAPGTGSAYDAWRASLVGDGPMSLVRAAVLAANAHDSQPWLFGVASGRVDVFADRTRSMGALDPLARELEVSLGCALENAVLAGRPNGFEASVTALPDPANPDHVARISLVPTAASPDALFAAIAERRTNRAAFAPERALDQAMLEDLVTPVASDGADITWLIEPDARQAFGQATVEATEAIVADADMARDDFAWYRQDWGEIQRRKDGITMDAGGLDELMRVVVRLLPPSSQSQMQQGWVDATRDRHTASAAAYGLVTVADGRSTAQRIAAGRALQRVWLSATTHGVALQPLNQVLEMADHEVADGSGSGFSDTLAQFVPDGRAAVVAFRVGWPAATPNLSPRRPAEEVLHA